MMSSSPLSSGPACCCSNRCPWRANCWVVPRAMVRFTGLMARERSAGGVTVRVVDPETPPTAAVIVVVPAAIDVAIPREPAALLMEATEGTDDVQLADAVRTCVLLSE